MTLADALVKVHRFGPTTLKNLSNPAGDQQRKGLDVIFLSCKPAKKKFFT